MNKNIANIFKGDRVIWMVFMLLSIISIIEVYSASSSLTYKVGNYWAPIIKHTGLLFVGLCFMIVMQNIACRWFKLATPFLLFISFVFLIVVLLTGSSTNGAQRWISFIGIQFQPSEIAKGAMVLAVAQILSGTQTDKGASPKAFKWIFWLSVAFLVPIMVENLSTAVLLGLTILGMMIVGRVPWRLLAKLVSGVMLTVAFLLCLLFLVGDDKKEPAPNMQYTETLAEEKEPGLLEKLLHFVHRADTWKRRVKDFANTKYVAPKDVDLDKDGQKAHAAIAIASSNIIGKGFGNSVECDFLSQAFSDFIFAIIIEEMGIEGGVLVELLYIILFIRTGRIASRCENNFPAFLAMGLAMLLVTQALFNMLVAVGLAPITGQPLPLISKGGTSTIINCVYLGVILSVSRSAKKRDKTRAVKEKAQTAMA